MDNTKQEQIFKSAKEIDKKIDNERKRIKSIDHLYDEMVKLNKQVNRCVEILSTAMQGPEVNNTLSEIYDDNRINYKKASESFEIEIEKSKKQISNLHKEKEDIIENIKKKYTIEDSKNEKKAKISEKNEKN